jgi:hypothetical protein
LHLAVERGLRRRAGRQRASEKRQSRYDDEQLPLQEETRHAASVGERRWCVFQERIDQL